MIGVTYKNIELEFGALYRVVGDHETLLKDDLVRYTYYWNGSDYVDHDTFKRMNWGYAKDIIPGWIGKSLKDYENFVYEGEESGPHPFEVIRKGKR